MIIGKWNNWKQPFAMGILCAVFALLISTLGVFDALSMEYMGTYEFKFVGFEENYDIFKSENGKYVYKKQNDSRDEITNYLTKDVFIGGAGFKYFHKVNGESIVLFKAKSAFLKYLYGFVPSIFACINLGGSAWMYKKGYGVKDFKGEPPKEDNSFTYFNL